MSQLEPLEYSVREIRSFLPGGWDLARRGDPGAWDADGNAWKVDLVDTADMVWTLEVPACPESQRLSALAEAARRLQRNALG